MIAPDSSIPEPQPDTYGEMKRIDWGDLQLEQLHTRIESLQQTNINQLLLLNGLNAAIDGYKAIIAELVAERDRARSIAVRLEQELAWFGSTQRTETPWTP